jgi:predicted RNA binding protein YcfA (HicA-like mRNA interferase family)
VLREARPLRLALSGQILTFASESLIQIATNGSLIPYERTKSGNQFHTRADEARMAKLLNQRSAIKLLKAHGWIQTLGGKHNVKMTKPGRRPITLPRHHGRDYGRGLTRAIVRQAGINPRER